MWHHQGICFCEQQMIRTYLYREIYLQPVFGLSSPVFPCVTFQIIRMVFSDSLSISFKENRSGLIGIVRIGVLTPPPPLLFKNTTSSFFAKLSPKPSNCPSPALLGHCPLYIGFSGTTH